MFNGFCNLSNTCTYTVDSVGDYWNSFAAPQGLEILFITGNGQYWAQASYATVIGIVTAVGNVFSPNITWTDAGRAGVSLGSNITGNILSRTQLAEDPWITLEGGHCASGCAEIVWGEANWGWWQTNGHTSLQNANGGLKVYVKETMAAVPVPAAGGLLASALIGLGLIRRRARR